MPETSLDAVLKRYFTQEIKFLMGQNKGKEGIGSLGPFLERVSGVII